MTYVTYAFNDDTDQPATCHSHTEEEEATLLTKSLAVPLPKLQLASLCLVRLADPIAMTQIFPYINQMLSDLHVADRSSQVGFYSGIVDSVFSIAQLGSLYHFGRLSDKVGRRPVILLGLCGVAFSTFLFGLSSSFFLVMLTRLVAGALSGNLSVIHTALGEMTDPSNEAQAFPIYGLMYPIGSIIGPILGGSLSQPAKKYPAYFNTPFFRAYPYFLPCFVASVITSLSIFIGYWCLDETHPTLKLDEKKLTIPEPEPTSYGAIGASEAPAVQCAKNDAVSTSIKALLAIKPIRILCTSGFSLSFTTMAFDVVFVLFCFSPIQDGGLGFSPEQIGFALAIAGLLAGVIQFAVLPLLLAYLSPVNLYLFCMFLWPVDFALMPLLNVVARMGTLSQAGVMDVKTTAYLWTGIALVLALSKVACLAFTLSMLLTKAKTPKSSMLGSTNGLVQSTMCLARAFSPAFVSSLYAFSLEKQVLGGKLIWIVMIVISVHGCYVTADIVGH